MGGGKTTDWTDEEEDIFVELLLESVHNGSIVKGSVNSALWVELTNRLNARTNRAWTTDQVSQKYGRLRKDHKDFSGLLHHETGFGWDPVLNTVCGTPTQWERVKMVCSSPN